MGLLDDLKKQILGDNAEVAEVAASHPALPDGIIEMLSTKGLTDIVQHFKEKGLGDVVSSWVGKGTNLPITADQLHSALGPEAIESLAQKVGLPAGQASSLLAKLLPGMVDKLTPHGHLGEEAAHDARS